jgi:hypothetical protein
MSYVITSSWSSDIYRESSSIQAHNKYNGHIYTFSGGSTKEALKMGINQKNIDPKLKNELQRRLLEIA